MAPEKWKEKPDGARSGRDGVYSRSSRSWFRNRVRGDGNQASIGICYDVNAGFLTERTPKRGVQKLHDRTLEVFLEGTAAGSRDYSAGQHRSSRSDCAQMRGECWWRRGCKATRTPGSSSSTIVLRAASAAIRLAERVSGSTFRRFSGLASARSPDGGHGNHVPPRDRQDCSRILRRTYVRVSRSVRGRIVPGVRHPEWGAELRRGTLGAAARVDDLSDFAVVKAFAKRDNQGR